jgi:hypothetical protein
VTGVVYFASDRDGGYGGYDLYSSEVDTSFLPPENMGTNVNSPGNELDPAFSMTGDRMFLSSNRSGGQGGYDLFEACIVSTEPPTPGREFGFSGMAQGGYISLMIGEDECQVATVPGQSDTAVVEAVADSFTVEQLFFSAGYSGEPHELVLYISGPDPAAVIVASFDPGIAISEITGVGGEGISPRRLNLFPSYPNPANPTISMRYELSASGETTLFLFDVQGRLVRKLVDKHQRYGLYHVEWDGRNSAGKQVASGVYFLRLKQKGVGQVSRKITVLK